MSDTEELAKLRAYVSQAVPFLEEAWRACFHGQTKRLLSAEERGMGRLLREFRAIRDCGHPLPPGMISQEEATKYAENRIAWAHRLLGSPNDLRPEIRRWVGLGQTCADGLKKADGRVQELEREVRNLESALRSGSQE